VRLTGIALRHQGTPDSLCAYYAAAMLLCALRPELDESFDAAHVGLDPLVANLPRPRRRSVAEVAAEWLTSGVKLRALARALDAACAAGPDRAVSTRFGYRAVGRGDDTVAFIRAQIDRGLPCVLGWESEELGNHTALVVGYERFARSRSRWLRLLDPIRIQDVLEWGQLERLAKPQLELLWCREHDGVRPDKLTVTRDRDGALVGNAADRWEPAEAAWRPLLPRPK
jgi:hypothetical protein